VRRTVLLAVTGALLLGFLPAASAREPASTTHTFGFVWDDIKTCEGETIIFSGQASTTVHRSWTPDGSFHFAVASHFVRATGVSDSGVTYRVIGGAQGQNFKIFEGEEVVREIIYADEERLVLISENGDSNWLVTIIVNVTTTPDGEVTAEVYHSDNKCLSL
jgi:hypothetical protein